MKVALCLNGQPRVNIKESLSSINKHVIEPTNCDVFMYVGKDKYVGSLFGAIDDNKIEYKSIEVKTDINIKKDCFLLDYLKLKVDSNKNNHTYRCLQQWYGYYRVNRLKSAWEKLNNFKYDWVIRCRFDMWFVSNIDDLTKLDNNLIYSPFKGGGGEKTRNDRFAFGSSKLMDIYMDQFNELLKIDSIPKDYSDFFSPESHVKYILDMNKIEVAYSKVYPIRYGRKT